MALAMMVSMFTFTAEAGTAGKYEISYEPVSVASGSMDDLAVNDTFFVVVKLTDAEAIQTAGIGLNWNSAVVKPVKSDNTTLATAIGTVTTARADSTLKKYFEDDDAEIAAFSRTPGVSVTESSILYEIATATTFAGQDYEVSGDVTMFKLRLKVVGEGNVNLAVTEGSSKLKELNSDPFCYPTVSGITALTVGGAATETKYFAATLPACEKADASTAVQFQFDDSGVKKGYDFVFGTILEAVESVKVGLEVKEAPAALALENVIWK